MNKTWGSIARGEFMYIKKNPYRKKFDYHTGLNLACREGQYTMIEIMVYLGGYDFGWDWDDGLSGACQGLQIGLIEILLERGCIYMCDWCGSSAREHIYGSENATPFELNEKMINMCNQWNN
jgi:hypothetical protein